MKQRISILALAVVAFNGPPVIDPPAPPTQALNSERYKAYRTESESTKAWLDSKSENGQLKSRDDVPEFNRRMEALKTLNAAWTEECELANARNMIDGVTKGIGDPSFPGMPGGDGGDSRFEVKTVSADAEDRMNAFLKGNSVRIDPGDRGMNFKFSLERSTSDRALKATMTTAGTPGVPRFREQVGMVQYAPRPTPTLRDLIPVIPTTLAAFQYLRETAETNNAGPVAEGAARLYSDFTLTPIPVTLQYIGHLLKATREQMLDVPQMAALIEGIGMAQLGVKLEGQYLNGTGVSPQIQGIFTAAGVQVQAKGADPTPDAFFKAMQLVRSVGFAEPTAHVMHPDDWTDIRLLRTADGAYLWGDPSSAGVDTLWGKPVIQMPLMTVNTGMTGAWNPYSAVYDWGGGVEVAVAYENVDDFERNLVTYRIQKRTALAVLRPLAFCKVTGI